jgi:hypothetical protein
VLDEQDPHVWIFKSDWFIWFARMNYAEYSTIVVGLQLTLSLGSNLALAALARVFVGTPRFFGSRLFCYAKATAQMALSSAIKCSML